MATEKQRRRVEHLAEMMSADGVFSLPLPAEWVAAFRAVLADSEEHGDLVALVEMIADDECYEYAPHSTCPAESGDAWCYSCLARAAAGRLRAGEERSDG